MLRPFSIGAHLNTPPFQAERLQTPAIPVQVRAFWDREHGQTAAAPELSRQRASKIRIVDFEDRRRWVVRPPDAEMWLFFGAEGWCKAPCIGPESGCAFLRRAQATGVECSCC